MSYIIAYGIQGVIPLNKVVHVKSTSQLCWFLLFGLSRSVLHVGREYRMVRLIGCTARS